MQEDFLCYTIRIALFFGCVNRKEKREKMMMMARNPMLVLFLICFMGGHYSMVQCSYGFTTIAPPTTTLINRRRLNNNNNNLQQYSIGSSRNVLGISNVVVQKMLPFDHHDIVSAATTASSSSTSSFLTAVEVFDGSDIVDPVVVSNVFWAGLKGKIISVIIGQILATIAFGLLASFAASKLSQAGDYIIEKTTTATVNQQQNQNQKQFIKAKNEIIINPDFTKLLICLAIDIIGTSSELIPILGEATDIIYAPIAGYILRSLYGSNNILFILEFTEEILPFTDVLPLATICWVVDTFFGESDIARVLQLGEYNRSSSSAVDNEKTTMTTIDTTATSMDTTTTSSSRMILPDDSKTSTERKQ